MPTKRIRPKRSLLFIITAAILLIGLFQFGAAAQDVPLETPTNTPLPGPVSISNFEPAQVLNTESRTITVFGSNFANSTVIRLVGAGVLATTFINTSTLTASLPSSLTPGAYQVQVVDPIRGIASAPAALLVFGPTPTPFPLATFTIPTPQPGQPSLIVRNFAAQPDAIRPGETTTLSFEVVNVGSRPAEGITISLGEGRFTPAIGQSSVTIPDINPGGTFDVALSVVAAANAEPGSNPVPLVLAYRDFEGETYTSNANLSVNIIAIEEASQVTITSYTIVPDPVTPGNPAVLRVDITNTGTVTVNSALLRVAGENSILLAGARGDSVPLGDIEPGETVSAEVPMIVSASAEPGPKSQPITVEFFEENEEQTSTSSITINVANPVSALLLLQDYGTGVDVLKPGDRFTLSMTLTNVGDAPATNALLTFGTVTSSTPNNPPANPGNPQPGSPGTGGTTTTTEGIPGNAFAPLGSGNTIFIGSIEAGGSLEVEQEFIVSGTVQSGIYNLPITVRYREADGGTAQENLQASVVVIAPPRLQPTLLNPLPPQVNVGDAVPLTLEIRNNGTRTVDLTRITVTADNADIPEGADQELRPVRADDDTTVDVVVFPTAEGALTVTFTLYYLDDLNTERSIDLSFDAEVVAPPPLPEFTPPPDFGIAVPTEEPESDMLERLLLGFLGLGG